MSASSDPLDPTPPEHWALVHGFDATDPVHRDAGRGVAVRRALHAAESMIVQSASSPGSVSDTEMARLEGLARGLAFWVEDARERPGWAAGLALETRDRLWSDGHPLPLDANWPEALASLLGLAGHGRSPAPVPPGTPVLVHGVRPASHETSLAAQAARILAAPMSGEPDGVVETVLEDGALQVRGARGALTRVARSNILPAGDPTLRARRARALEYCRDALVAATEWAAPAPIDRAAFGAQMRARLRSQPDLWTPE